MATTQRRGFGKLRRLPSGRWQASYIGPDTIRHAAPHTFMAKLDADAWLTDTRRSIEAGTWSTTPAVAPTPTTLSDYFTSWLETRLVKGKPLAPRTKVEDRRVFDQRIAPTLGQLLVKDITPDVVRAWYAAMGSKTPTRKAHAYQLLSSIMKTAVEVDELLPSNPCRIKGAGQKPPTKKIVRPATIPELALIVEATPERYQLMVLLASWTALRFGELTELRRTDVDIKAGVVRVTRAVSRVEKENVVGDPKSDAGIREVAIPPHLIPVVAEHLRSVMTGRDGLLFPAPRGGYMNSGNQLTRWWFPARAAAGRDDMTFHDLRHTGGTMAARTGATLKELMGRLGHSTVAAAMRYQHVAAGRDQAIAAALSEMAKA